MSRSRSPAGLQGGSELKKQTSLLIPANPAYSDPGSSPVSRGGILLNPLSPEELASSTKQKKKSIHHRSSNASNTSLGSSISSSSASGTSPTSTAATSLPGSDGAPQSPRLKFAPLPASGKKRSNSIALGVSARAQMLAGQVPQQQQQQPRQAQPHVVQPCWQDNVASVKPMWYNGGPLPDNVKTVHDIKPGMKKLFGKLRRRSSASSSGQRSESADSNASSTSDTNDAANPSTESNGQAVPPLTGSALSTTESIPEGDEDAHIEEEERGRPLVRDGIANVDSGEQTPRRRASPTHPHTNDHSTMQNGQSALLHHHLHLASSSQPGSGASTPRRRMSMTDMQDSAYADRHVRHNQAVLGYDETQFAGKFNDLGLHRFASPTSPTQESESALDTSSSVGDDESMSEDRSIAAEDDDEDVPLPTNSAQAKAGEREIVHGHAPL